LLPRLLLLLLLLLMLLLALLLRGRLGKDCRRFAVLGRPRPGRGAAGAQGGRGGDGHHGTPAREGCDRAHAGLQLGMF
jgi:hypothetical protein